MLLTACSPPARVDTVYVKTAVPEALLAPCVVDPRPYETLAQVALIVTDHVEALERCNDQVMSIAEILKGGAS